MDAEKLETSMKSNEKVIMEIKKMDNFYSMESNVSISIEGAELCTMDCVTLIYHNSTFLVGTYI